MSKTPPPAVVPRRCAGCLPGACQHGLAGARQPRDRPPASWVGIEVLEDLGRNKRDRLLVQLMGKHEARPCCELCRPVHQRRHWLPPDMCRIEYGSTPCGTRCRRLYKSIVHAVFEVSKGVAERLRDLSGSMLDGADLVDRRFSTGISPAHPDQRLPYRDPSVLAQRIRQPAARRVRRWEAR